MLVVDSDPDSSHIWGGQTIANVIVPANYRPYQLPLNYLSHFIDNCLVVLYSLYVSTPCATCRGTVLLKATNKVCYFIMNIFKHILNIHLL